VYNRDEDKEKLLLVANVNDTDDGWDGFHGIVINCR
jgi:hypothetical protein